MLGEIMVPNLFDCANLCLIRTACLIWLLVRAGGPKLKYEGGICDVVDCIVWRYIHKI